MKLYQLPLDFDLYPETAGFWLVVSSDGNHELSAPVGSKDEAKIEMSRLNPDYCENIVSLKINREGNANISALGVLGMKAIYSIVMKRELEALFVAAKHHRTANRAWVYKFENNQFVLKSGQPTKHQAATYLQKNSILVSFLEG